ncbi:MULTISPECIES: LysR family transcriptional regulator [Yersinia]|uniref:LysR family transcriptional regulator n=1 Tax=Yersinia TaxID=629 RepID=UPI0003110E46|nr:MULTISPECIES: LysR family transcriptional regulator [Yersinia]MCB5300754.1 LysR family transcriptional regulator [Yersinia bercovieri]QDW33525.1 LysR family transcriptional regulator [Yersinia sp. KBS0713]QKJ08120.1 LysR family transcriptional regulator [Yersinia bercovieri ATCC 43970]CFQ32917.1 LysR family transcriptional regulator [Yersinia bercovieri]
MFLSRKLEAFMAVVENGSLSKAARVMNRTTPPVAKSIKDFEYIIGKKLFKREKFGMSLTRDGEVLYNDLKDLYQQEKEITKKHLTGHVSNVINIYYDWGKNESLTKLCKVAEKNNIQANVIKFYYENIDDIGDYDGNSLILSSEIIPSDKFMLLNEVPNSGFGIYGRKDVINESQDVLSVLHHNIWLCNPVLYRSNFVKNLEESVKKQHGKVGVRQVDNLLCCLNFIYSGKYICITDSVMDDFDGNSKLDFISLSSFNHESKLYFYKSRSHSSVLNRLIDYIHTLV